MKRLIIIWFSILILLMGCQDKNYAKSIESGPLNDYVDYELGVNFTDHMWAIAYDDTQYLGYVSDYIDMFDYKSLSAWYELMFTQRVHYMYPQMFYFIPMGHNFDNKKKWETYFEDWELAIETQSYSAIEKYVGGLSIEPYVKEVFQESSHESWQIYFIDQLDFITDMKAFYLTAFDEYYEKVWPELSFELNRKANYVNEVLRNFGLRTKWEQHTQLDLLEEHVTFSLSKVEHDDFEFLSLKNSHVVLYYDIKQDPYEFVEVISQRLGYILLSENSKEILQDILTLYYPLKEDYNLYQASSDIMEFTVAQYNTYVMGYQTDVYEAYLNSLVDLKFLKFNVHPQDTAIERLAYAFNLYFERLKTRKPYKYDDGVHYDSEVYEALTIDDSTTLHYKETFPMILETDAGFEFVTNYADSIPLLSSEGDKILFISPYQWELIGDIFIYDFTSHTLDKITSLNVGDAQTIKRVQWYDAETIYYTKGFAYGTLSYGGDVYKMNLLTREETPILMFGETENKEVTEIDIENNILKATVRTYDDAYNYTEEIIEIEVE